MATLHEDRILAVDAPLPSAPMATRSVDAHAGRSRSLLSAGLSLLVLVALLPCPVGAVKELAFADIDPAKPDQVSPNCPRVAIGLGASPQALLNVVSELRRVLTAGGADAPQRGGCERQRTGSAQGRRK